MTEAQFARPHDVDRGSAGPSSIFDLSEEQFDTYLSHASGRGLKLVYFVLLVPAVLLAVIALVLAANADPASFADGAEAGPYPADLLFTGIHLAAWCVAGYLAGRGFAESFSERGLRELDQRSLAGGGISGLSIAAQKCSALFTEAYVLRMAKIEGPALFGVVVCLLGVHQGWIFEAPLTWVNLLGIVGLTIFAARTFPTEARRRDLFRRHVLGIEVPANDDEPALLD